MDMRKLYLVVGVVILVAALIAAIITGQGVLQITTVCILTAAAVAARFYLQRAATKPRKPPVN